MNCPTPLWPDVSEFRLQVRKSVETRRIGAPRSSSWKSRNSERETCCQIVRPANPGHSSTSGMILGIWNAVRRARWNQIKTKLRSVRLRAHNLLLSMNFDRYKGNKRRKNRERGGKKRKGKILCLGRELFFWAARQQNLKKLLPWGRKKEL